MKGGGSGNRSAVSFFSAHRIFKRMGRRIALSRWVSWAASLIVAFAIAGGAVAAPKPSYDKPPKWVDVAAVPEAHARAAPEGVEARRA